ncbi:MAG: hypothetical protein GF417_10475 [Candidatus Latescibacteria bacterium]|nr:hypothetical protein [bacterium]MBD3424852.1 hypothetical protein [Candidatus Latescibacterota bacterium]
MKKIYAGVLLTLLAFVFTIGLTFASVEIPRLADDLLGNTGSFPNLATGQDEITDYKTELYISHYNIRIIGYISLALIVALIAAGFILEKRGLASLGAVALFLPAFGHFASTMFFLGGLAFLRFLWLPFLDISFNIMRLGNVIVLPYEWIMDIASWAGFNLLRELPYIITGLGLFIFLLGVLAWMYGRWQKRDVADFWIYRFSRHPQYLGWIIWSYGVLFLPGPNMKQYVSIDNTLPWLITALVIIGVAMLEERKMKREHGAGYEEFRAGTPFLFPLPRFIRNIFSLPVKILFRKDYPERKREIVSVMGIYLVILIALSVWTSGIIGKEETGPDDPVSVEKLSGIIRTTSNRNDIRHSAAALAEIGGAGVDSLIAMLEDDNQYIRWYCAQALGSVRSDRVVQPLAELMINEPYSRVQAAAAGALGRTGSEKAAEPLIEALQRPELGIMSAAARALGNLRAEEAFEPLVEVMKMDDANVTGWAAWALGEIGNTMAIQPLIEYLESGRECNCFKLGEALQKLGSARAEDAFIKGLNGQSWWIATACAEALGRTVSEKGERALIETLKDGGVRLRRAAVLALRNFKGEAVTDALRKATGDTDMEIRVYARGILKEREGD